MRRGLVHIAVAFAALVAPAAGKADGATVSARVHAASARCDGVDTIPGEDPASDVRDATLCLMNAQRTARGLPRLRAHFALELAATRYARQMVRDQFFAHTSPGGATMVSRIKAASYFKDVLRWTVGENLAWGTGTQSTPRATVEAWMRSPDHRANLLDRDFEDVGIGVATGAPDALEDGETAGTYVTDFGSRVRR
jgi:uncharacterized protein YkwD